MVTLKLDVVVENLNKIKTTLNKSFENMGKKSGSKGGIGAGAIAGIGASVAIFTKLLSGIDSINKLLEIVAALINQLVAPFVPILLGLIKPVFVLLQKFLFGAMQSLGLAGFGVEGDMGIGETIIKWLLTVLAGVGTAILAVFAGASVGWALAIGAAIALLVPLMIDFGKWLGDKLMGVGAWIGELLASGLASIAQWIFNIFGVDLLTPMKEYFNEVLDVFSGIIDIIVGVFTLDWEKIKSGFMEVFSSIWEILTISLITNIELLRAILMSAWEGIKSVWDWLLQTLKSGIISFANSFIKGLNGIIGLLNKVPGVDIGYVRGIGSRARDMQTTINVTVQGNANENTINELLKAMRREQTKRGTGTF